MPPKQQLDHQAYSRSALGGALWRAECFMASLDRSIDRCAHHGERVCTVGPNAHCFAHFWAKRHQLDRQSASFLLK